MRRLIFLAALLTAAGVAASASARLRFPRDHYGHPNASIEWWYSTALARDNAGTRYLVFFALFSSAGSLVSTSQVTNLDTGAIVGHSEQPAFGIVGTSSLDVRAGKTRLSYDARRNTWSFAAGQSGYELSLQETPTKPYAVHGGGSGVIPQSAAGTSHYYSATRMTAAGELHAGGKTLELKGQGWLDHQWGSFRGDPRAFDWDWFSCRFDDGTELMLYQFLDRRTGRPLARFRSGTWVLANGVTREITMFDAVHGTRLLKSAGRSWPLDWRLEVPALGLSESVQAIVPDQLVRGTILPTFWEGASTATGSRSGTCVVELSHR